MPAILTKLFNRLRLLEDYDTLQVLFNDPFEIVVNIKNIFIIEGTDRRLDVNLKEVLKKYAQSENLRTSASELEVTGSDDKLIYAIKFKIVEDLEARNLKTISNLIKDINEIRGVTNLTMNHIDSGTEDKILNLNNLVITIIADNVTNFQLFKFITLICTDPKLVRLLHNTNSEDFNWASEIKGTRFGTASRYINNILEKINIDSLRKIETFNVQDRPYIIKNFFDTLVKNKVLSNEFSIDLLTKSFTFILPNDAYNLNVDLHKDLSEFEFCLEYIETCINTLNNIFSGRTKNSTWEKYSKYCGITIKDETGYKNIVELRKSIYKTIDEFFNEDLIDKDFYEKLKNKSVSYIVTSVPINNLIENKNLSVNKIKETLSGYLKNKLNNKLDSIINKEYANKIIPGYSLDSLYISIINSKINTYFYRDNISYTLYYIILRTRFYIFIDKVYGLTSKINKNIDSTKVTDAETIYTYNINDIDYLKFIDECSNLINSMKNGEFFSESVVNELTEKLEELEKEDFIKNGILSKISYSYISEPPLPNNIKDIYNTLVFVKQQLSLLFNSDYYSIKNSLENKNMGRYCFNYLDKNIKIFESLVTKIQFHH
jgi:hypothetical protein